MSNQIESEERLAPMKRAQNGDSEKTPVDSEQTKDDPSTQGSEDVEDSAGDNDSADEAKTVEKIPDELAELLGLQSDEDIKQLKSTVYIRKAMEFGWHCSPELIEQIGIDEFEMVLEEQRTLDRDIRALKDKISKY